MSDATVMIVDGHEDALTFLEHLLANEGFHPVRAWSGAEALSLLRVQSFDVLLVNEYLPDIDCEDLIEFVRSKGGTKHFVVMQPAAPTMTGAGRLRALGACHVVQKNAQRDIVAAVADCAEKHATVMT